jgi:hypothetical protein
MYWHTIEKTAKPGNYDEAGLRYWDQLIREFQRQGINPVVVVRGDAPGCSFANQLESYEIREVHGLCRGAVFERAPLGAVE